MARVKFKNIIKEVKSSPVNFPFFNAFVTKQFILFLDDRLVKFAGNRKQYECHTKKRPVAVMEKKMLKALFVPGSTKKNSNRYAVFAAADAIKGLVKNGWFLIRYYQYEQAGFFEQGGKCEPGSKVPDKLFNKMQEKLNAFIEDQAG